MQAPRNLVIEQGPMLPTHYIVQPKYLIEVLVLRNWACMCVCVWNLWNLWDIISCDLEVKLTTFPKLKMLTCVNENLKLQFRFNELVKIGLFYSDNDFCCFSHRTMQVNKGMLHGIVNDNCTSLSRGLGWIPEKPKAWKQRIWSYSTISLKVLFTSFYKYYFFIL